MEWKIIFKTQKYILSKILFRVSQERLKKKIYPSRKDVFNSFVFTPFNKIKVVIIGQDPYCNKNQAHGLAFSVPSNCIIPPSLKNIYQELHNDLNFSITYNRDGCLKNWSKQGVFLLNSVLTVESGFPGSHFKLGWQEFTDNIISYISFYLDKVIFLLWGKQASKKKNIINLKKHYVFQASHPSPLSANFGFFGCRHFSKVNKILLHNNKEEINW